MKYIERMDEEFYKLGFLKKYLYGTNGIIAGGCFKHMFNNEKFKDIDIFFRNMSDFNKAKDRYYNDENFKFKYKNENVVAFIEIKTGITVELIKKVFGEPNQILDHFDFTITKVAYYYDTDVDQDDNLMFTYSFIHHEKFFEHLHMKKIVIENNKLEFPFSTLERAFRYCDYGYHLCKKSKKNLIEAIREPTDFNGQDISNSLYNGLD